VAVERSLSARQRPKGVPHLPKPVAHTSSYDDESATATTASGLRSAPKSSMGEKAATPRQPVALARVFWISPRQFTLGNRRLPLALPQSFGKLRNLHVSLESLSARFPILAMQKLCSIVQKLWRTRLPCGRLRKTENKYFIVKVRGNNFSKVQVRERIKRPSAISSRAHEDRADTSYVEFTQLASTIARWYDAFDWPPEFGKGCPPMFDEEKIVRDPQICGGEPVFRGTRVTLRIVLASLAAGDSVEEILADFPSLKAEHVRAAIAFAAASAEEDMPVPATPHF